MKRFFLHLSLLVFLPHVVYSQLVWLSISDSRFHDLQDVYFADDRVGIACQQDSIFITNDEGLTWSLIRVPGVNFTTCKILVDGSDTCYFAGSVRFDEVYFGYGVNDVPKKLNHAGLLNLPISGMTDVVKLDSILFILGAFRDSVTDHPVIFESKDFGLSWGKKIFLGEDNYFSEVINLGGDTLMVLMKFKTGAAYYGQYWYDHFTKELKQYPVANYVKEVACQSRQCIFSVFASNNLLWYSGKNFFQPPHTFQSPSNYIADIAFFSPDEVVLIQQNPQLTTYEVIAYHLTDSGYDARVKYVMTDSLKPLNSISVTDNYTYIGSSDVIYKAGNGQISVPAHGVTEEYISYFVNQRNQSIDIVGINEYENIKFQIVGEDGRVINEGIVDKYNNQINIDYLNSALHILMLYPRTPDRYYPIKFFKN